MPPKDDRLLSEFNGVWRQIQVGGAGITAANNITALYASADAAPLDGDGLAAGWGTTLGAITASAGTQPFAATPTATGQSARAMQVRVAVGNVSGDDTLSPYLEAINITLRKDPPFKYIRTYEIDLDASSNQSTRPRQAVIDDLDALVAATTDLSVTYGSEPATPMEPWFGGGIGSFLTGPILYEDRPSRPGTVREGMGETRYVKLSLVEV